MIGALSLSLILGTFSPTVPFNTSPAIIEIGSGVTSVYFAKKEMILKPILFQNVKIPFSKDLTSYQKITEKTEILAVETLNRFKHEALAKGADSFIVVATEAFRQAPNGDEIRQRLQDATGLAITILSSQEEARLGFLTAACITHIPKDKLTVFDMGSGSMQWAVQNSKQDIDAISKPLGTAIVMNLFKNIRPDCTSEDIYPVSSEEMSLFCDILEAYVHKSFADATWQHTAEKGQIAGIGFVQLVAIGMGDLGFGIIDENNNTIYITIEEVYQALQLITSSDKRVRDESIDKFICNSGIWKNPAPLSLALMYILMKQAGFESITSSLNKDLVGNAVGILSLPDDQN